LDNHPDISQETKARVRAVCAELGYVPNAAAKGLAGHATHTIGLVVPDISNPYFFGMAAAVEQTAAAHGYRVLLSNSMRNAELEHQSIDSFMSRQVDGLLISATSPQSQARHHELLGSLPCVYFGVNHDENCSYVMADNEAGAYKATQYLISLGHRDILFLGGRPNSRTRNLRLKGFYRAMEEAGLKGRDLAAHTEQNFMRQWTLEQSMSILTGPLPDAVFAFSDTIALKVMEAAEHHGLKIPEDFSLIGYDNISFSALPRVDLTTVSQQKFRQGIIATERLLEKINGTAAITTDVLEAELKIRSTCANKSKGGSHN
jgi:LacI family transcriptional regulator